MVIHRHDVSCMTYDAAHPSSLESGMHLEAQAVCYWTGGPSAPKHTAPSLLSTQIHH